MYSVGTDFYLGLPMELWDNLILETEDLFSEEEIGTHILGIYTAGNRIYGIENQSQGLLCLYFDSIDSIIDPIPTKRVHKYNIGNQNSPVWFVELREWVRWLLQDVYGLNKKLVRTSQQDNLFHLIPSMGDNLYEDISIRNIIYYVQEMNLIQEEAYYFPRSLNNNDRIYNLLSARTRILMQYKREFVPNINKEWGEILTFNCNLEDKFIDMIINNESIPEVISEYNRFLNKFLIESKLKMNSNYVDFNRLNYKQNLRKEIIKLYRSLS